MHGVETFFLEDHGDAELLQFSHVVEAVHGVSCESADRLRDDLIDLSLSAHPYHSHEVFSFVRLGTGDAFVSEDSYERPFGVAHDLVGVCRHLCFKAQFLFVGIGGYSAVGCRSQLPFYRRGLVDDNGRRYHSDGFY